MKIRFNPIKSVIAFLTILLLITIITTCISRKNHTISLYSIPVGEGLSLLIHTPQQSILYDTGNRFRAFDAGKHVIIPLLKNLKVTQLDTLILSLNNQQHTGGARSIQEAYPQTKVVGHQALSWLIEDMMECSDYHIDQPNLYISPIPLLKSSCGFKVILNKSILLYLISDITAQEWMQLYQLIIDDHMHESSSHIHETIILYPNQGRKAFMPDIQDLPIPNKTILFSTQKSYLNHSEIRDDELSISYYNAYYGTIHIEIPYPSNNKNAKSQKLRIHDYRDDLKYWWLKSN